MKVNLCQNCIKDLKDYNPYITKITIKKVKMTKCDNYSDENGILNIEKRENSK